MRSRIVKLLAVAAFAVSMFGSATPAHASTCAWADPTVEQIYCDTIWNPTMSAVCGVVHKATGQCFA